MTLVNRSGTEEQYTEREQLLTEHQTMADEKDHQKGEEAKKAKEKDNQDKAVCMTSNFNNWITYCILYSVNTLEQILFSG